MMYKAVIRHQSAELHKYSSAFGGRLLGGQRRATTASRAMTDSELHASDSQTEAPPLSTA